MKWHVLIFIVIIAAYTVDSADAVCTDNRITVYTNIQGAPVTVKALINVDEPAAKKTLVVGETWDVGRGYSLTVQSINATASPRNAWLVFRKDGVELDNRVLSQGQTYSYSTVFSARIDSIFAGAITNAVQFRYVYFFSEPYFWETKSGAASTQSGNQWYWESDNIYFSSYGSWTASYNSINGYLTPANETKTASGNCLEFTGVYRGGDIIITTNLANAIFTVSGPGSYSRSWGGTSWSDYNVMGGSYTASFADVSGYTTPASQTKYVNPGSAVTFSATYTPAPMTGSIAVSSSPSGASIYLDDVYYGTTPSTMTVVSGSHTITLKLTGYQDWLQTVNVVAGQTSAASPQLKPATPTATLTASPISTSTPEPTSTPPPGTSNSYIYGIVILSIVLIVIGTLRYRGSYQKIKPAKTETKIISEAMPETVQPPTLKETQKLDKCPFCGAKVLETDSFCGECGKQLRS